MQNEEYLLNILGYWKILGIWVLNRNLNIGLSMGQDILFLHEAQIFRYYISAYTITENEYGAPSNINGDSLDGNIRP